MTKRRKIWVSLLALAAAALLIWAFHSLSGIFGAFAEENADLSIERLDPDDAIFKNGYLDRYGVPTEKFEYSNNGSAEQGAPLSYAFDRNFGSIWRSQMQFNGTDETVNYVEAKFNTPVEIDRILYQADASWSNRGSFTRVRISYIPEGGKDYTALEELDYPQTSATNANLIKFKTPRTVEAIKIEWLKIHTGHRTCAAASEIIYLQPQSEAVEKVQKLFTDYAQLHLDPSIETKEQIEALRGDVMEYASYDSELSGMLSRAEQILEGKIVRDARREMGTAEGSENLLTRYGDVAGYARSTLKMSWFGTNRQATGISVTPADTLTVYVDGEDGDPLPRLVITQHWGAWSGWKSGEYTLRLGKNVIHPQDMNKEGYKTQHEDQKQSIRAGVQVPTGGPIYLVNPYTEKDQSENVKVYIEGGTLIPIFRKGGDVNYYKEQLAAYADTVENEWQSLIDGTTLSGTPKIVDVTEIVSENIIVTVRASRANKAYNEAGYDPQHAAENWDAYVKELLESDGVIIKEEDNGNYGGKYDPRARYLNCNIRLMQPYGAAYAFTEHVGIQVDWEMGALTGESFGWGYTHELGHMMDIGERTVSECSNNMLSKYDETVMSKIAQRGDFDATTAALAPDEHAASFWNTNRGNFIFWWFIESFENGWWPTLENLYRYEDIYKDHRTADGKLEADFATINATEKQVLLSSIAAGYDLSYYFERWGYNLSMNDPIFARATASASFNTLMEEAKKAEKIKRDGYEPKIWYVDADEWWARKLGGEKTSIYSAADRPEIKAVTPCDGGYAILIDGGEKCKLSSHLGFEILEGKGENKKVVGFTTAETFTDKTEYDEGYIPVYSVVAYDRALTYSGASDELSAQEEEIVCKIGSKEFSSVRAAVKAAGPSDTIVLVKSCYASGIVIDKPVAFRAENGAVLCKNGSDELFLIAEGGKLTLTGTEKAHFMLDGSGAEQISGLIRVDKGGSLDMDYCTLQNCNISQRSASNGALSIIGDADSRVTVNHTNFERNSSRLGGAVYSQSGAISKFENCTFTNNEAQEGGAVYSRGTSMNFLSCTFRENSASIWGGAIAGTTNCNLGFEESAFEQNSSGRGGAIYVFGALTLKNGSVTGNTATEEGGAIMHASTAWWRAMTLNGTKVADNTCEGGAAIYTVGTVSLTGADLSAGGCLYVFAAASNETVTFSGGKLAGDIYKNEKCTFTVRGSLFTASGTVHVVLVTDSAVSASATMETVLFQANFTFASDAAAPFSTSRGEIVVDGSEIRISLETVELTFHAGDKTWKYQFLPDKELVFNTDSHDETTYVTEWSVDGAVYRPGESYLVTKSATFEGTVAKKTRVEFHYGLDGQEDGIVYVIPGESYSLPRQTFEKHVLNGWYLNDVRYLPGSSHKAEAGKDLVYTAEIINKFVVRYWLKNINGGEDLLLETLYYAYGEVLAIAGEGRYEGDNITDFIPDGSRIETYLRKDTGEVLSDTYAVVCDLELEAVVEEQPIYVNYTINYGDHLTNDFDEVKRGTDYTLAMRTIPYGYHITRIRLNSVGGRLGYYEVEIPQEQVENFVIEDIDAIFCILDIQVERNDYTVTYTRNGEEVDKQLFKYESELVLSAPKEGELPEKHHFVSLQVGREQMVLNEEGEYVEALQFIDLQLDENGETKYVVTDDIVINTNIYIEVEAQPEDPSGPIDPTDPDGPTDPDDPSGPDHPTDPDDPNTPDTPDDPNTPDDPSDPAQEQDEGGGISTRMIAGIAVGGVALIGGVAALLIVVKKRRRR